MPRLPDGVRRAFRLATGRPRVERDVDAEVAFHLHMRTEELVARGMSAAAARDEALRRFGDVQRWSEAMSETDRGRVERERRAEWWDAAWQDLRVTARALWRQPGFTLGVVLTLALGIGANATMFGIVDLLMLRAPAHVRDAGRVHRLFSVRTAPDAGPTRYVRSFSYAEFVGLRDSVRSFSGVGAWSMEEAPVAAGPTAPPRLAQVAGASAGLFPLLGVRPHLGRFFTLDEDRVPAGTPVAVLGYDLWRSEFGGDPGVIGRTIRVRTRDLQIVGVAPPGFSGADLARVDVWMPLALRGEEVVSPYTGSKEWDQPSSVPWHQLYGVRWLDVVARLAPGATPATAAAELNVRYPRLLATGPDAVKAEELARTRPRLALGPIQIERGPDRTPAGRVATWLAGVSFAVLLIACANVANLLLARATRRRREIAVRTALGISRRRLVTLLLLEGVLLAALGGAAGLLVAHWGGSVVRKVLLPDIAWGASLADVRVLAFTAGAALLTGLLASVVPAVQAARADLTGALKAGAREGGGRRSRLRLALLVAQGAVSVVLLVGAGLFVRSLRNVTHTDYGYDPVAVLAVEMNLSGAGYTEAEQRAIYDRLHERVRALPGVASVSLSVLAPFRSRAVLDIKIPGLDSVPTLPSGGPMINVVTPDYFRTMGTRVVRGRGFTGDDRLGAPRVIVVNETMARVVWPRQNPIGKCVRVGDSDTIPCSEVVGVAEEARWGEVRRDPMMQYYAPLAQKQWDPSMRNLFVRPEGDATDAASIAPIAAALRREALAAAPKLAFVRVRPLQDYLEPSLRPWRLGASVFGAFGLLALVIAAVGLYSVLAYTVAQRTHEIGVRIALGARLADVLRLVVGEGLRVTVVGMLIGLAVALVAGRRLEELLYEVSPRDPLVFAVVAGTLLVVAALASLLPAWRAARVDPNVALRVE